MPTYGYECVSCSNQIEVFQSIKDDPLTTCESCGGSLRKRIYPVGIAFKGSGFYVNDYAPKSEPAAEAKSDAAKPDGAKPDGAKPDAGGASEAKAEPKSEAKPEANAETPKAEAKSEPAASAA